MTVMLDARALEGVISMRDAIDLLEGMSRHEAAGRTSMSPRVAASFDGGWMRMMFGADYESGYAATKAYHMVEGAGVRYVVSLYRLADGELLAVMDGRLITDLRTGAASGVVARKVPLEGPVRVGLLGAGHQSRMQLESLAAVYRVESASVYSPTAANRERCAAELSGRLGIPVKAVASAEAAVRGHPVVVAATSSRSSEPVLRGAWLEGCRLLCAVGSTRPQSVEVDVDCFRGATLIVVDSARAVEEAGDLQAAVRLSAAPDSKQASLASLVAGKALVPSGRVVFKSVGSALQDLALATRYYERLAAKAPARVESLASLKTPVSALFAEGRLKG
jgi:ornithine cyclodeaminase/alanine dehydrogenase-like protein (mu-crystallin family)